MAKKSAPQPDWLELETECPLDPLAVEDAEWIERRAGAQNADIGMCTLANLIKLPPAPHVCVVKPFPAQHPKLSPIRHPNRRKKRRKHASM